MTDLDTALFTWLRAYHAPWLDVVMSVATISGIWAGIWQLSALLSLIPERTRAAAFRALLALWLGFLLVDVLLKPAFARPRPAFSDNVEIRLALAEEADSRSLAPSSSTYSFPSGHATSAVIGARMLSLVWPRVTLVWWLVAALIAYSRIYLGHHYPLDVLGGVVLGYAVSHWVLGRRTTVQAPVVVRA